MLLDIGSISRQARSLALPKRYLALAVFFVAYLGLYHVAPAIQHHYQPLEISTQVSLEYDGVVKALSSSEGLSRTTNLVIASTASNNVSWIDELYDRIPRLKVFHYVSDDPTAEFHPSAPKGREALMYFTYLYEKYESLADVNIFIHAEEQPWHLDGALQQSMMFALSHLDLEQVVQLQYFNLYTSLKGGRLEGYNTSKTVLQTNVAEEPFLAEALRANFGEDIVVPEIFMGPCCSQFAVSKEAITSRSRDQYKHSMEWLTEIDWPDQLTGRVWEHMWPWLFLNDQAVDLKTEWRTLCRMYGVCFLDGNDLQLYQAIWDERKKLMENIGLGRELIRPWSVRKTRRRLNELSRLAKQLLLQALERGRDPITRIEVGFDLTAP